MMLVLSLLRLLNQTIAEPLVVSLLVIVFEIFTKNVPKRAFTKKNQFIETFALK